MHSPDLFHGQRDMLKPVLLPLNRPIQQAQKDLEKATQQSDKLDTPADEMPSEERLRSLIESVREELVIGKQLEQSRQRKDEAVADGGFVDRRENVLVFGPPGSGKTHLLCAVAQELVRSGRKVLFATCNLLVQELLLAKRELKLPKLLKRVGGYEVLLVDDLGYVQQSREEMEVLFTLLAERYERGSVLLTSNLAFSGWESIFKDPMTTAAAIDRLVHHSVIVELNVASFRLESAKSSRTPKDATPDTAVVQ